MNNFIDSFENMNLVEMLGMVIGSHDKNGIISREAIPKDIFTSVEIGVHYMTKGKVKPTRNMLAQALFQLIYRKFMQCTEKERRSIIRSDMEFIDAIKKHIIYKIGIVDHNDSVSDQLEQEVYGSIWMPTPFSEIPKIPRGQELFWSQSGDPEPEPIPKQASKRINGTLRIIWRHLEKSYPVEYAKILPELQSGKMRLAINTDKKETSDAILNETGQRFYNVAVPWLTNAAVSLVTKTCRLDKARQKEMYAQVMKATWETLSE